MKNDLFVHANGLIKRFRQEAEKASEQKNWTAAQTWFNAVSIVEEPEANEEILKQFPTVKLPPAVECKRITKGKWVGDRYFEECSICGSEPAYFCSGWEWDVDKMPNFCPNCGADMRGDNDE